MSPLDRSIQNDVYNVTYNAYAHTTHWALLLFDAVFNDKLTQ